MRWQPLWEADMLVTLHQPQGQHALLMMLFVGGTPKTVNPLAGDAREMQNDANR